MEEAHYWTAVVFTGGATQAEADANGKALIEAHKQATQLLSQGFTVQRHEIVPLANGQALIYFWLTRIPS